MYKFYKFLDEKLYFYLLIFLLKNPLGFVTARDRVPEQIGNPRVGTRAGKHGGLFD